MTRDEFAALLRPLHQSTTCSVPRYLHPETFHCAACDLLDWFDLVASLGRLDPPSPHDPRNQCACGQPHGGALPDRLQ
jgi:hypothetical protein